MNPLATVSISETLRGTKESLPVVPEECFTRISVLASKKSIHSSMLPQPDVSSADKFVGGQLCFEPAGELVKACILEDGERIGFVDGMGQKEGASLRDLADLMNVLLFRELCEDRHAFHHVREVIAQRLGVDLLQRVIRNRVHFRDGKIQELLRRGRQLCCGTARGFHGQPRSNVSSLDRASIIRKLID